MQQLAAQRRRFGDRRLHVLLRQESLVETASAPGACIERKG